MRWFSIDEEIAEMESKLEMMTKDLAEQFGMEVLRQLVNKTQGEKFFRVEFGAKTHIVGFIHPDPWILDFDDASTQVLMFQLEQFLEPVATALILQIREGSFDKIADLPIGGPFEFFNWRDAESNLAVRSHRFFEFQTGRMFTKFEIGVEQ